MLKNIISTFFTHSLSLLLGIINSVLLARFLGVEGKGALAILLAFIALFTVFLNIGLPSAVTYFISNKKFQINKIFYTGIILVVLLSILFVMILLFNNNIIKSFLIPSHFQVLKFEIILGLLFFFKFFNSFIRAIFLGIQIIIKLNKIDIVFQILSTAVYVVLFYALIVENNTSVFERLFFLLLIQLIILILNSITNLLILIREDKMRFGLEILNKSEIKFFLSWGGIAYFANFFQFLCYRLDFWFVEFYSGLEALGIYSLSVNLIQIFWLLPNSISVVLFPYLSEKNNTKLKEEKTLILGRIIFTMLAFIGTIALITSSLLITFFYGKDFASSSSVFNILLISSVPYGLITVYSSFLAANGMQIKNMRASFLGLISTIILDVLMIPKYGIIGAAFASSISYFLTSIYVIFTMKNYLRVKVLDLFLLKKNDLLVIKKIIYATKQN